MDANEANSLLRRYLEGNASPEEIQLVEQWYQELGDAGEWNWAEGEKESLEGALESRLLQQIRAVEIRVEQTRAEETPVRKMTAVSRVNRRRWMAAAVFVLLAGIGSWLLLFNNKKAPVDVVKRFSNDVAPGRNAAILTLAGGKAIVLDSGATGHIGTQGNTTLTNNNGRLTYTALHEKPGKTLYNTLTTARGNKYQLTLPDGTTVWLNAASSITYPTAFTGHQRKVTISGEAYFEIAADKSLPFLVQEGDMTVQVLGTHFNINGYDDEPVRMTTLLQGAVQVFSGVKGMVGAGGSLLKPGQQARLARNDHRITVVNDADPEAAIAWKNGEFAFTEVPIESVMRQVARWYDVDIVYDTPVSGHFVGDIPRNVPLSKVLKLLELTNQVHFSITGKKITVTR